MPLRFLVVGGNACQNNWRRGVRAADLAMTVLCDGSILCFASLIGNRELPSRKVTAYIRYLAKLPKRAPLHDTAFIWSIKNALRKPKRDSLAHTRRKLLQNSFDYGTRKKIRGSEN